MNKKENTKNSNSKSDLIFWWLSVLSIFGCFFSAQYFTPMCSDDFFYSQLDSRFSSHFDHYMRWSGRLLSDYAASLILRIHNHSVVSAIIAGTATALCFLISNIPNVVLHDVSKKSYWRFFCIGILYWIFNPCLG